MESETPELENEEFHMPEMKRCDECIHAPVCGAYNQFPKIVEKFEDRFQYIDEFPAKAIALATMCKEYKKKKSDETINEYECNGCSDRDGL